jgi:hypothetical protein
MYHLAGGDVESVQRTDDLFRYALLASLPARWSGHRPQEPELEGCDMHWKSILAGAATLAMIGGGSGALAGAASAATYNDTSFQANPPETQAWIELSAPNAAAGSATLACHNIDHSTLAATGPAGWTTSSLTSCSSPFTVTPPVTFGTGLYTFSITGSPNPSHGATERAIFQIVVTAANTLAGATAETFSQRLDNLPNTEYPNIVFTGHFVVGCNGYVSGSKNVCTDQGGSLNQSVVTVASSAPITPVNPATGLVTAGNILVATDSTLAPGTFDFATVTDTADGAVASETFTLQVSATRVHVPGVLGDEVNPFGNGFDVYQQHFHAGAVIAGWSATKTDPATQFLQQPAFTGAVNTWRFEAVNGRTGIATGLCVSDPGGGWASDPLPNGLILTSCNTGPFQEFVQASNGTLTNVKTGLIVNPDGTGAQLRGMTTASPWGGSFYKWTDEAHLP